MYFTYLLHFKPTNQFYYGVCYKNNRKTCDLWKTYFSSSKLVHSLIDEYGVEAFDAKIRRIFADASSARRWETKVLKRMRVVRSTRWLNKTDNISFEPLFGDDNPSTKNTTKARLLSSMNDMAIRKGFSSYSELLRFENPSKNPASAKKIGEWKKGKIWVTSKEGKYEMISPDDVDKFVESGYTLGRRGNELIGKNKGKKFIHKNDVIKSVLLEELQNYLDDGWSIGRPKDYYNFKRKT